MSGKKPGKILSLEMSREKGRIKVSAFEKSPDDEKTIRHHEFKDINDSEIKKLCDSVVELLNRTNQQGRLIKENLKDLQTTGQVLYDSLLTGRAKEKLASTNAESLIVNIDDRLVQVPWEILYDGSSFLCQRFNMGRVVSTSQRSSEPATRKIGKPLSMLVVSDPRGDLQASYTEGLRLRDTLDRSPEAVEVHMRSSPVDVRYLKGSLRDYDIVHYAGHADYNTDNPSESGFLLHDGRLRASDIMNMIGPSPLPSLVFSNACKSGHTEMWKVDEDFETSIYGLANAFLLAGVQHYIGTFWDVQDEPSLYFALDFYKELIDGATAGEAVRKARLRLIERYGEETIIWASYMLYGDPTVRYVDHYQQAVRKESEKVSATEHNDREEVVVRGTVRGRGEAVSLSPGRRSGILIASAMFIALAILLAFSLMQRGKDSSTFQNPPALIRESDGARDRRIKELVASLIKTYKEDQITGRSRAAAVKQSRIPTIAFLNIYVPGINDTDNEFIFTRVINALQNSGRVHVIEREIIDELLKELELGSSELADRETALRIGRILSAKLISVGSIVRDRNNWQVSLRFIETETTSIKAALAESMETGDKKDVADMLGREILKSLRTAYPLKGMILSRSDEGVVLDVGRSAGAAKGLRMKVLSEAGQLIGELKLTSVSEDASDADIISKGDIIKAGLKVEELL